MCSKMPGWTFKSPSFPTSWYRSLSKLLLSEPQFFLRLWTIQLGIQSSGFFREPLRSRWDVGERRRTKREMGPRTSIAGALFLSFMNVQSLPEVPPRKGLCCLQRVWKAHEVMTSKHILSSKTYLLSSGSYTLVKFRYMHTYTHTLHSARNKIAQHSLVHVEKETCIIFFFCPVILQRQSQLLRAVGKTLPITESLTTENWVSYRWNFNFLRDT